MNNDDLTKGTKNAAQSAESGKETRHLPSFFFFMERNGAIEGEVREGYVTTLEML